MKEKFVGAKEIERWFGVSRQRIQQLIARPDWPAPCAVLSTGKIWLREDVEAWASRHRPELSPGDDPALDPAAFGGQDDHQDHQQGRVQGP